MSKNYTATLVKVGFDSDGTEWHTYRVFNDKRALIGYTDVMPTGMTTMDETVIEGQMDTPDDVSITIESHKS